MSQSSQDPHPPEAPIQTSTPSLAGPENTVPSLQDTTLDTTRDSSNDWLLEPAAPNTLYRARERGWTISDWYSVVEEDGRTYQGYMPGEYWLPNDGEEQDRQDFQHAIYDLMMSGELAEAPIQQPRYVLDIGTGTGIWAIDFAEKNPTSHVIGTDLSVIQGQPRTSNCEFVLENSETQEWLFPFQFDYIHLRGTGPCFNDIHALLQKTFQHMKPGGWIEFQDGGWEIIHRNNNTRGSAFERWVELLKLGAAAAGRDLAKMMHYKHYLPQAGFVNVKERKTLLPITPWAKGAKMQLLGHYLGTTMISAIEGYKKYLVLAGLSPEEIDSLATAVRRDLHDMSMQWVMPFYVVYGQKPPCGNVSSPEVKVKLEPKDE